MLLICREYVLFAGRCCVLRCLARGMRDVLGTVLSLPPAGATSFPVVLVYPFHVIRKAEGMPSLYLCAPRLDYGDVYFILLS